MALHSRCTLLASFDIRMQQAASALGLSPVKELSLGYLPEIRKYPIAR